MLRSSGYVISQMNIWGNKNELKLFSITFRIQDVFLVLMEFFFVYINEACMETIRYTKTKTRMILLLIKVFEIALFISLVVNHQKTIMQEFDVKQRLHI